MDNIRGVVGCPVAGLTPNELFDASPVVREFTHLFVGNKAFTNLPRKFNVTITACKEVCTHAESQDLALTPATQGNRRQPKSTASTSPSAVRLGSGGFRMASPLRRVRRRRTRPPASVQPYRAIFRDHGARELRTKARLAFLIESWGVEKFRHELERRVDRPLACRGNGSTRRRSTPIMSACLRQKQAGLNYVGLAVPVGRMTSEQMLAVARIGGDLRDRPAAAHRWAEPYHAQCP